MSKFPEIPEFFEYPEFEYREVLKIYEILKNQGIRRNSEHFKEVKVIQNYLKEFRSIPNN